MVLPAENTDAGLEVRVLLAEVRGPGEGGYTLADATKAMQWMHVILGNRIANPQPFGAHSATLKGVVTAHGQFAGFERYPVLSDAVRLNIEGKLRVANAAKDRRSPAFQDYLNAALTVAQSKTPIADPSPGKLASWRTAGADPPGGQLIFYATLLGNDYYYLP